MVASLHVIVVVASQKVSVSLAPGVGDLPAGCSMRQGEASLGILLKPICLAPGAATAVITSCTVLHTSCSATVP